MHGTTDGLEMMEKRLRRVNSLLQRKAGAFDKNAGHDHVAGCITLLTESPARASIAVPASQNGSLKSSHQPDDTCERKSKRGDEHTILSIKFQTPRGMMVIVRLASQSPCTTLEN